MTKYVIRCLNLPPFPTFAVVQSDEKGYGRETAWFFDVKTAEEYVQMLDAKANAVGEKVETK